MAGGFKGKESALGLLVVGGAVVAVGVIHHYKKKQFFAAFYNFVINRSSPDEMAEVRLVI